MKKIIATVLAMVMALALCTTAFAATVDYTGYDSTGKKYEYSGTDYKFNITFVDGDYDKTNHAMTGADVNSVDHYDVVVANDSSATVAGASGCVSLRATGAAKLLLRTKTQATLSPSKL